MFYPDKPVEYIEHDKLGRGKFAEQLARTLLAFDGGDTFTVGLSGKWGCGKTSLVNMTLSEIEKMQQYHRKLIVVQFEPWNFYDTNQLMTQFFTRLSNELRNVLQTIGKEIGEAIIKYSGLLQLGKVITGMDGVADMLRSVLGNERAENVMIVTNVAAGAAEIGKTVLENALDETDVLKQKEKIIKLLKRQDQRVLIVIDDIDRLSNEQIRCIFQLVASVANFPRITYLLVYDKEVVVHALEEVQRGRGEDYLEKIVQIPIEVVDIESSCVLEVLDERVKEMVWKLKGEEIDEKYWEGIRWSCIEPFVKDLRDVNRLCNLARFKLSGIYRKVNICDMLALCALELFHPVIYQWVKRKKGELTGSLDLLRINYHNREKNAWNEVYQKEIWEMVEKECGTSSVERTVGDETKRIIDCLATLFPYFGRKIGKNDKTYNNSWRQQNDCISVGGVFGRYFSLSFNMTYTMVDVNALVEAVPKQEIVSFILEQDQYGMLDEVLYDMKDKIIGIGEERAEIIYKALIEVCPQLTDLEKYRYGMSLKGIFVWIILTGLSEQINAKFILDLISKAGTATLGVFVGTIMIQEKSRETGIFRNAVCQKTKELLKGNNLFDFYCWCKVYDLLESVDKKFAREYLQDIFQREENIVKFLGRFVEFWSGYVIKKEYKKYIDGEHIKNAIEACRRNRRFYTLELGVQERAGAFYAAQSGHYFSDHDDVWIEQEDVDIILAEWRVEDGVDTP